MADEKTYSTLLRGVTRGTAMRAQHGVRHRGIGEHHVINGISLGKKWEILIPWNINMEIYGMMEIYHY